MFNTGPDSLCWYCFFSAKGCGAVGNGAGVTTDVVHQVRGAGEAAGRDRPRAIPLRAQLPVC